MPKLSSDTRIAAWHHRCVRLMAFALLWGWVIAPFAQALTPAQEGTWVQVCTSLGTRFVQLDREEQDDSKPAPSSSASADCPYCGMHGNAALIPARMRLPVMAGAAHVPPGLPASRPVPADPPWRPDLPRAPPRAIFF